MNTLEQDMAELRKISEGNRSNGTTWHDGRIDMAKKALSVIERLQEENQEYIKALRFVNGSFATANRQAQEAHKVLKKFGKL